VITQILFALIRAYFLLTDLFSQISFRGGPYSTRPPPYGIGIGIGFIIIAVLLEQYRRKRPKPHRGLSVLAS
jgi:hypothetical protein